MPIVMIYVSTPVLTKIITIFGEETAVYDNMPQLLSKSAR